MRELERIQLGNPILRKTAKRLSLEKLKSQEILQLIQNMRHTLVTKKFGVGLAAPQVGKSLAIAVIAIRPTKHRPKVTNFDLDLINPEITEAKGRQEQMWEGCLSSGEEEAGLFAKVPRYEEVKVKFWDASGVRHEQTFNGLKSQIIQHEVDHLNGILFVDRVKDAKTYMTHKEYMKAKKQNRL